jgi:formylmethanofuran dehydrogenase subunit E
MITILYILITWYLAKVYYTKTFTVQMPTKEEGPMVHVRCAKCSQTIYTHRDNLRAPYYCLACN